MLQKSIFILALLLTILNFHRTLAQSYLCTPYSCRNGDCEQFPNRYTCHCYPGSMGDSCQYLIGPERQDACLSNPCWNGGICTNLITDYRCSCPGSYTGKDCRILNSPLACSNNPCKNNGICRPLNNNGFFCACVGSFTGTICDTAVPLCLTELQPCFNGGKCVIDKCDCPSNFTGDRCQTYKPTSKSDIVLSAIEEIKIKPASNIEPVQIVKEHKIKTKNEKKFSVN